MCEESEKNLSSHCDALHPLSVQNFAIQNGRGRVGKWGWTSHARRSRLVLPLRGQGALHVAFLCSYTTVGQCTVTLQFADRPDLPPYHAFKPLLKWPLRSSQQCVFYAGNYQPGSVVVITSDDAGQVKLYGLYSQQHAVSSGTMVGKLDDQTYHGLCTEQWSLQSA
jgi:hypothetical protein